jgi:acyl-coenzyme A synthetase/AMP-(fatty) acid ligase
MAIKSIYENTVVDTQDSQGIRGTVVKAFVVLTKGN